MRFWCIDCRKHFSVKTNTVMHRSRLGLQQWGIAIYQMTVNLTGLSSMKLSRDLGVTQKTAWHLAHRIREATVTHSAGEYVNGQASTDGMESFWASLKRGYIGVYHWFSVKHRGRYVWEFSGRHNFRPLDTIDQMSVLVFGMIGKRLTYTDLIGPPESRVNCQLQLL